ERSEPGQRSSKREPSACGRTRTVGEPAGMRVSIVSTPSASTEARPIAPAPTYWYSVYGVSVGSDAPFDFPAAGRPEPALAHIELTHTNEELGDDGQSQEPEPTGEVREESGKAGRPWCICRPMADGSVYLRWRDLYEFRIENTGTQIRCRPLESCDRD